MLHAISDKIGYLVHMTQTRKHIDGIMPLDETFVQLRTISEFE